MRLLVIRAAEVSNYRYGQPGPSVFYRKQPTCN